MPVAERKCKWRLQSWLVPAALIILAISGWEIAWQNAASQTTQRLALFAVITGTLGMLYSALTITLVGAPSQNESDHVEPTGELENESCGETDGAFLDFDQDGSRQRCNDNIEFDLVGEINLLNRSFQKLAALSRSRLFINPPAGLSNKLVGDFERLREALSGIIANAFAVTEERYILLAVENEFETDVDVQLIFRITDPDARIRSEIMGNIPPHFTASDPVMSRPSDAIKRDPTSCNGIIESMGGRIGFDAWVGVGSTFWFRLTFRKSRVIEVKNSKNDGGAKSKIRDESSIDFVAPSLIVGPEASVIAAGLGGEAI